MLHQYCYTLKDLMMALFHATEKHDETSLDKT